MQTLEEAHVAHFFDAVVMSGDVGTAKPDPIIFQHMVEQLHLDHLHKTNPRRIIFVGNETDVDVVGANGIGWTSCLLTSTEPHSNGLAHYEVANFADLERLLFP